MKACKFFSTKYRWSVLSSDSANRAASQKRIGTFNWLLNIQLWFLQYVQLCSVSVFLPRGFQRYAHRESVALQRRHFVRFFKVVLARCSPCKVSFYPNCGLSFTLMAGMVSKMLFRRQLRAPPAVVGTCWQRKVWHVRPAHPCLMPALVIGTLWNRGYTSKCAQHKFQIRLYDVIFFPTSSFGAEATREVLPLIPASCGSFICLLDVCRGYSCCTDRKQA